jgi:UDP-3-O-[3-hydroxymyristoyl] N-acetylglucosamine deacetylase
MELRVKTLRDTVSFRGVGIHTGEICEIKVHPRAERGIVFYKNGVEIPAHHNFVVGTTAGTDLGRDGEIVKTVEHLMAALYLTGVDAAVVEVVRGREIPILDGSAKPFFDAFRGVGITYGEGFRRFIKIGFKKRVQPNGIFAVLEPFEGERFEFEGEFPYIGRKKAVFDGRPSEALLGARTFCRLEDVEKLRSMNLGLGGTLLNTLVLDEGLSNVVYSEEPAYHKLLDLIGDVALVGARVVGRVYSFKGGHTLNHEIRKALLKEPVLDFERKGELIGSAL